MAAAVEGAYGAAPLLSCHRGDVVKELWMCLSLDLTPVPCPPRVGPRTACHPRVRLPEGAAVAPACAPFFPPLAGGHHHHKEHHACRVSTAAAAGLAAAALALVAAGLWQAWRRRQPGRGGVPLKGYSPVPESP